MRIGKYFVALPYSNEKHNSTIHAKILKLLLYRIARRPDVGGRGRMFTPEQETHIVNMVIANNEIRLREIQQRIIDNDTIFQNIHSASISALSRVLARHRIRMKEIYRVPFERNTERVKQLRYDYVQRVMELEADAMGHELLFVDEAGFNLSKTRRRGRNIIGHRAIINVPGQRGGNITMCAAISQNGVVHHHATIGPYNTAHIIAFLDTLHDMLTGGYRMRCGRNFVAEPRKTT
ncbi:uncharacterized protein LOC116408604 [Xenopus tropicalis]|uniref:Uncharacterized protein LOC116408604 n=1 Tax=Xenopus tropicalis TaxID=8364 RepID=A0A8J1J2M3_XENTR|nr:uncharacterized protein LOC116408604 [Xenopus tropicalis]